MAIKALNPFAPSWYTPKEEEGSDNPTRFKIRGLDGEQMSYVGAELVFDASGNIRNISGKGIELALGYGLVDWENFENDDGPVKFNRANFRLIPYHLRLELAVQIVARSVPNEEERKN